MRSPLGMLCILLLTASACSRGCASRSATGHAPAGYSYLVTPSGRMFRVLKVAPALNAEHQKLGALVFYAGETPELSRIEADATVLAAALGPEREAAREKMLVVGVNFGVDPGRGFSPLGSYNTVFRLVSGHWLRERSEPSAAKVLEGVGEQSPPEDARFPYEAKTVQAAAAAAANWLALLDAGAPDAALAGMTEAFQGEVKRAAAQWEQVVRRRDGLAQSRMELYRQQSRPTNMATPPSGVTALEYLARMLDGTRVLERVTMLCESTGCKAAGYTFQPIRGG